VSPRAVPRCGDRRAAAAPARRPGPRLLGPGPGPPRSCPRSTDSRAASGPGRRSSAFVALRGRFATRRAPAPHSGPRPAPGNGSGGRRRSAPLPDFHGRRVSFLRLILTSPSVASLS